MASIETRLELDLYLGIYYVDTIILEFERAMLASETQLQKQWELDVENDRPDRPTPKGPILSRTCKRAARLHRSIYY